MINTIKILLIFFPLSLLTPNAYAYLVVIGKPSSSQTVVSQDKREDKHGQPKGQVVNQHFNMISVTKPSKPQPAPINRRQQMQINHPRQWQQAGSQHSQQNNPQQIQVSHAPQGRPIGQEHRQDNDHQQWKASRSIVSEHVKRFSDYEYWRHVNGRDKHIQWGTRVSFLPAGFRQIWAGDIRYYYCDGIYYLDQDQDYVVAAPPIGATVSTIPDDYQTIFVNGIVYYVSKGAYYVSNPQGYQVVSRPVPVIGMGIQSAFVQGDSFTVNIPNNNGGYSAVVIEKAGGGFIGPQGEFYPYFPAVSQLQVMYGQ